jgi:hypothetical protein
LKIPQENHKLKNTLSKPEVLQEEQLAEHNADFIAAMLRNPSSKHQLQTMQMT